MIPFFGNMLYEDTEQCLDRQRCLRKIPLSNASKYQSQVHFVKRKRECEPSGNTLVLFKACSAIKLAKHSAIRSKNWIWAFKYWLSCENKNFVFSQNEKLIYYISCSVWKMTAHGSAWSILKKHRFKIRHVYLYIFWDLKTRNFFRFQTQCALIMPSCFASMYKHGKIGSFIETKSKNIAVNPTNTASAVPFISL